MVWPLEPVGNGDIARGKIDEAAGNKEGRNAPRALFGQQQAVSLMPSMPPMPEPMMTPVVFCSSGVEGCQLASSSACFAAHIAKTMKGSTRR